MGHLGSVVMSDHEVFAGVVGVVDVVGRMESCGGGWRNPSVGSTCRLHRVVAVVVFAYPCDVVVAVVAKLVARLLRLVFAFPSGIEKSIDPKHPTRLHIESLSTALW